MKSRMGRLNRCGLNRFGHLQSHSTVPAGLVSFPIGIPGAKATGLFSPAAHQGREGQERLRDLGLSSTEPLEDAVFAQDCHEMVKAGTDGPTGAG